MKEIRSLIDAFDAAIARGERCALATLVSVDGSAYRRSGARMLITESGMTTGAISAGCLDGDVVAHAQKVLCAQPTTLIEYNTAATNDEVPWGLGLGCDGIIRILIEPLSAESRIIDVLRRSGGRRGDQSPLHIATAYQVAAPRTIGARVVIEDGHVSLDGADEELAMRVEEALRARAPSTQSFDLVAEGTRIFVETILPPVRLVVFGAGQDVLPVVELARGLGWQTEVVDLQARGASVDRFANADKLTLARPDQLPGHVTITPRTMALVISHDYLHDVAVLRFLLPSAAGYIGVVGARKRAERMLKEVASGGDIDRIHAPAGLDIGVDNPEGIAVAIIAEMCAVLDGRCGGMLRDRKDANHARPDAAKERALRLATG